jgi:hypothetical protein
VLIFTLYLCAMCLGLGIGVFIGAYAVGNANNPAPNPTERAYCGSVRL